MKYPKISVVIPSFNKVRFIKKTLDSILDQKYQNLEIIIQDGSSTDGTLEIIKSYQNKYQKIIKLESKKDNGQLDAINTGFKKATGEILTFINADDVYDGNAFEVVSGHFLENPKSLWFAGKGLVIDEDGVEIAKLATWYKNLLFFINSKLLLLITNYLMQPSVFITREAYKKYGPFTGTSNFVMEYEMWLKLARLKMPRLINKNLTKFRIEANTKTKRMSKKLLEEDERIIKKFTNNIIILTLHKLHNAIRLIFSNFV